MTNCDRDQGKSTFATRQVTIHTHCPESLIVQDPTLNPGMRLMNTCSKVLKEFHGSHIPPYTILSHVWGEEEVSLQDLNNPQTAEKIKGYSKITAACTMAVQD
jgi:hypothetical protein